MNPEDFEKRLQTQKLRQIPPEWREEILATANLTAADVNRRTGRRMKRDTNRAPEPIRRLTFASAIKSLFWPSPKAWAGLATVWAVIFAVNFSVRDRTDVVAENTAPPSPEIMMAIKQQERLLAELIGPPQPREADRPKPGPRSERIVVNITV